MLLESGEGNRSSPGEESGYEKRAYLRKENPCRDGSGAKKRLGPTSSSKLERRGIKLSSLSLSQF